jgi:hypothetical protein
MFSMLALVVKWHEWVRNQLKFVRYAVDNVKISSMCLSIHQYVRPLSCSVTD